MFSAAPNRPQSINSDRCEQQGHAAKDTQKLRVEALATSGLRQDFAHGAEASHRQTAARFSQFVRNRRDQGVRLRTRTNDPNHALPETGNANIGHLCHGNIHGRKGALIESVFEYVTDHADNLARGLVEFRAHIGRNIDLFSERIFSRPVLPRHGLIDDDYFGGLSIIPVSKGPPAQERNFHGIEVRRRDVAPVPESVRRAKQRAPHHQERERGAGFEGQPGRRAGGNDPWQSAQALAAVAHELIDARRTATFGEVFAVAAADKVAGLGPGTGAGEAVAAADAVIGAVLDRAVPSREAAVLAWAGGALHEQQADACLRVLGAGRVEGDVHVRRAGPLACLADPASPRCAEQAAAFSARQRAGLAGAVLAAAGQVAADPGPGWRTGWWPGRPCTASAPTWTRPCGTSSRGAVRADPRPGGTRRPGRRLAGRHGRRWPRCPPGAPGGRNC